MSAIDELKNGISIDTTNGEDSSNADNDAVGVSIDTTDESNNRVDLSSINGNRRGNHQVIMPRSMDSGATRTSSSAPRKSITIDSVAVPEPEDESIHESPEKDILDLDNPDSIFSKYVAEKEAEAVEWITEKEEEKRILAEEEEASAEASLILDESEYDDDDDEDSEDYIDDEKVEMTSGSVSYDSSNDLDISGLLDDEKEEDNMDKEIISEETNTSAADIAASLIAQAKENVAAAAEEEELVGYDNIEDEDEAAPIPEKEEEVAPEEEIRYDAPDIDVEVDNSTEQFATEIIEEDEAEVADTDEDQEEILKHLQKLATEKLKPVSKSLDISSFTVLKKPVSNITPLFKESNARVAKWVLPAQESIVLMKEFSGSELEKLREYSESARSLDSLNRRFHMIYDHIVSPKPATFEGWLKTTPYEDVDHYFFAIYIASFKGANYLPEDCINPECKETFLTDDVNIMEMVKFDTKEEKELFTSLYQSEAVPAGKGVYCTEVVPINDKIAVAFRQPSVHNAFELASIDDKTRSQYSSILDYVPYIDTIYTIDIANQTLTPISYKVFADNAQRTIKSKIQKYDNVFGTLSVDEFGIVKAYVRAITDKTTGMRYVYPAVECPKCHTMTNEQRATAEELVFTRYQLGTLVTMSLN